MDVLPGKNKKLLITAVALAAVLAAAFFGARLAASYYYQKGLSQYRQNNYQEAKKDFSLSLKFNWFNPLPYFMLGRIALGSPDLSSDNYYPNADYGEAISYQEKAIQFGLKKAAPVSAYPQALDDLGVSYWHIGNYDKSVEYYLEIINLYPERSFWPRLLVAQHYFERANKPAEALDVLKFAPDLAQAKSDYNKSRLYRFYTLIARLYNYYDDFKNAEKYAKLAVQNGGADNASFEIQIAHDILALAAGKNGDFKLAQTEVSKTNQLADSKDANCILAFAYYLGKNYLKAIEIAKAQNPKVDYKNSICLHTLANSFLNTGQNKEAQKYMEDYMVLTDKFPSKNILVMRYREQFSEELKKLK